MKENLLLSIIVVTYNAENYLQRLFTSLEAKINLRCEVIIIDGKSNDGTMNIVKDNEHLVNKCISEKDAGIYDAMSKGIAISEGKFILFLGADDQLQIDVEELGEVLVDERTIYYGYVRLNPSGKEYGGEFSMAKLINRNICHQSIFYPRAVFNKHSFNKKYRLMADYALNLDLWKDKEYRFSYINRLISSYSEEGLSSTLTDMEFKRDIFKIIYRRMGLWGIGIKLLNPIRNFLKI